MSLFNFNGNISTAAIGADSNLNVYTNDFDEAKPGNNRMGISIIVMPSAGDHVRQR